jgi:hypothetical protein
MERAGVQGVPIRLVGVAANSLYEKESCRFPVVGPSLMAKLSDVPDRLAHYAIDALRDLLRILVLPDADDHPPGFAELSVHVTITALVGGKFLLPPGTIVLRHRAMLRTAVPEAPVDEDRYASTGKNQVGPPAHSG